MAPSAPPLCHPRPLAAAAGTLWLFDFARLAQETLAATEANPDLGGPAFQGAVALAAGASVLFACLVLGAFTLLWAGARATTSRIAPRWRALATPVWAAAPPAAGLAYYFGGGAGITRIIPRALGAALLFALFLAGATACAWAARWAAKRVATHPREAPFFRAGIVGLAFAVLAVDRAVLWGLYAPFHFTMAALAALAAGAAVALGTSESAQPRRSIAVCAAIGLAGIAWPAAWQEIAPMAQTRAVFTGTGALHLARLSGALRAALRPWPQVAPVPPFAAAPGPASAGALAVPGPSRPDVFIISGDGLRPANMSLYGGPRPTTPFLQSLRARALVYERAYAPTSYTATSLGHLVLGVPMPNEDFCAPALRAGAPLPAIFKAAGYRTFCDFTYAADMLCGDVTACDVLQDARSRDASFAMLTEFARSQDAPIFALVHVIETHGPYRGFDAALAAGTPGWADYDRALLAYDRALAALHSGVTSARERAAVWAFTSDHGESLGERGVHGHHSHVFEEQIRVPLVLLAPGYGPASIPAPVSMAWLHSTLGGIARAGIAGPRLPLAREAGAGPVVVREPPWFALIDGPWKLVLDQGTGAQMLFDLEADPGETQNLVGVARDRFEALRARLRAEVPGL